MTVVIARTVAAKWFHILTVLAFVCVTFTQAQPRLTAYGMFIIGHEKLMSCSLPTAERVSKFPLTWSSDGLKLAALEEKTVVLSGNVKNYTSVYCFNPVQASDQRKMYTCTANLPTGSQSSSWNVYTFKGPDDPVITGPSTVLSGVPSTLTCIADGTSYSAPRVYWQFGNGSNVDSKTFKNAENVYMYAKELEIHKITSTLSLTVSTEAPNFRLACIVDHYDTNIQKMTSRSFTVTCPPPILTINPTTLTPEEAMGTGGKVDITCVQPLCPDKNFTSLRIKHTDLRMQPVTCQEVFTKTIVTVSRGLNGAKLSQEYMEEAEARGDFTQRYIEVVLNHANCGDSGFYSCGLLILDSSTNKEVPPCPAVVTVNMDVYPGIVTSDVTPKRNQTWTVAEVLTFSCTAVTGTMDNDTVVKLSWEFQETNGSDWTPYDGRPSDVTTEAMLPGPASGINQTCYYTQNSTLKRSLTLADSGRRYRCKINSTKFPEDNLRLAEEFSVGNVTASDEGVRTEKAKSADDNTVTTTVVSLGVVVAVAIGAVLALWFYPRKVKASAQGQSANAGAASAAAGAEGNFDAAATPRENEAEVADMTDDSTVVGSDADSELP